MSDSTDTRPAARPAAATAAGWLAVLGGVGAAVMCLAHLGIHVPLVARLQPAVGVIPPAAAGFAVGTALYAVAAVGLFRLRPWAWPVATVVNALAFVSAAVPFRGTVSALAMAVSLAALAILVSPAGRRALLYRHA